MEKDNNQNKFDYGDFKDRVKTVPKKTMKLAEVLQSKYASEIGTVQPAPSANRGKIYISVILILILLVWIIIGIIFLFNQNQYYNAETAALGDAPVTWYIEQKELKKFSTCMDIGPGVIYNLQMGIKNSHDRPISLRVKIEVTYNDGIAAVDTNAIGVDENRFKKYEDWYYYNNNGKELMPADSGLIFATGIRIGLNNPGLNYYTLKLRLIAESYEGSFGW